MLQFNQFADNHVHAYEDIPKTMENIRSMSELGITDANFLAINYQPYQLDSNLLGLYYKEKSSLIRFRAFGGLYHDPDINQNTMPFKEQAELLLAMGCEGIKFIEMKPSFNHYVRLWMDDPIYDDLYDMLEKKNIPIVTHVGDPTDYYVHETGKDGYIVTQKHIYDSTLRRLERNPNLKITFAHFCFCGDNMPMAEKLFSFPGVHFDLTPGTEMYDNFQKDYSAWREFFYQYRDRILYGTDTDTKNDYSYIYHLNELVRYGIAGEAEEQPIYFIPSQKVRGFNFDKETQEKIFYKNYISFVGEQRKPLNRTLYKKHAEEILQLAKNRQNTTLCNFIRQMLNDLGL